MIEHARVLEQRYRALSLRIENLTYLRQLVGLPERQDILARQWAVINGQLNASSTSLMSRVKGAARSYLPRANHLESARALNYLLGEAELDLSRAYDLFDTYMDLLTQRLTPELGRLLAGCDALAWDAINRRHPALDIIEPPLVQCQRGFGAAIMREGVPLPDRSPNPLPIIEIPYSKLKEKYNLTSVLHEVGHEVMVRLDLARTLPEALRYALRQSGASETLQNFFGLWAFEIGPDFWAFCGSGIAAAGGIREILGLPPSHAFRLSWTDPHPPPYLRVLLVFECCRQAWGNGLWDRWEEEWIAFYPLKLATPETYDVLREGERCLPVVARALLGTRYRVLNGKSIPDLFNLPALAPGVLERPAESIEKAAVRRKEVRMFTPIGAVSGGTRPAATAPVPAIGATIGGEETERPTFADLSPCSQLAVFRMVRERGQLGEERLDAVMTDWLLDLGAHARPGIHH